MNERKYLILNRHRAEMEVHDLINRGLSEQQARSIIHKIDKEMRDDISLKIWELSKRLREGKE